MTHFSAPHPHVLPSVRFDADPHSAAAQMPADGTRVVIRDARSDDLPAMAALHLRTLPLGLFPRLGARFLVRWHRVFLDSQHGIAVVALHVGADQHHLAGFLVGSTDRDSFRRELFTRRHALLWAAGLSALLLRPATLVAFVRTRLPAYTRRIATHFTTRCTTTDHSPPFGELAALAIATPFRRNRIAHRLAHDFLAECADAGTTGVELVSPDSAEATAFYVKTGWTHMRRCHSTDGAVVNVYHRQLTPAGVS